jgi:AraC-like DNA-binding protein
VAALSLWKESLAAIYDVRLIGPEDAAFHCRAEAFHLGELVLTAYRCSAQTFDRPRSRIGRDGIDHYTLQFCVAGRHGPRDGTSQNDARPGDLLIADLAQPHSTGTSDFDSLNLTIPRRLLAPLLTEPNSQNLRLIPGTAPLTTILRRHIGGLFQAAPGMSQTDADVVVGPTLALAAAVLNARPVGEVAEALDPILATQVRRFLSDRSADHTLTADSIAARFGISRRRLYSLLEPQGGVAAYLREQRLQQARAMLRDPERRTISVEDVARNCGFAWRTNFARTFRQRFGVTPVEARTLASRSPPLPAGDLQHLHMWDWIRALR